ncbi:MAG: hypothetical protein KC589_05350 [Nanoarchaeota archaeon]|nr:hypothetical protein [Nanoarchaeota archaeon]
MEDYVASYLLIGDYTRSVFPMRDDTLKINFRMNDDDCAKRHALDTIPNLLKCQYSSMSKIMNLENFGDELEVALFRLEKIISIEFR